MGENRNHQQNESNRYGKNKKRYIVRTIINGFPNLIIKLIAQNILFKSCNGRSEPKGLRCQRTRFETIAYLKCFWMLRHPNRNGSHPAKAGCLQTPVREKLNFDACVIQIKTHAKVQSQNRSKLI